MDRESLDPGAKTALEAAEKEHGELGRKIALVITAEGPVIIKRPHRATVSKFLDAERATSATMLALVKSCIVYPGKDEFDRLLDEQPAALTILASEALTLAGAGAKALAGK
jgi:hypothetical protein